MTVYADRGGQGAGDRDLRLRGGAGGIKGRLALPCELSERKGANESPSLAAPSSAPRPHPRRCHGFPLLSRSGAALQALLGNRRLLLPAPARGVDAGKGGARGWEL